MSSFDIERFRFKTKTEAMDEYRRLSHSTFLTYEDCCKVISLARFNPSFNKKIGKSAHHVKDVTADNGLWVILDSGERLRVPVKLLIDLAYSQHKAVKEYAKTKGLKHFKKACKYLVRGVKVSTINAFIDWAKLNPQTDIYTTGEKGLHYFIDDNLRVSFLHFVKVYENHSYRLFYGACRVAILPYRPSIEGKEAHHANEGGFTKIVQDFIKDENINLDETFFVPRTNCTVEFLDSNLRDKFVLYHNSRVSWQMMTPKEHKSLHFKQAILT